MAEPEELRRAKEEAQRAREEAQKAREQAQRLGHEARDMAHRLRREFRDERRQEREDRRNLGDWTKHGYTFAAGFKTSGGDIPPGSEGARIEQLLDLTGVRVVDLDQTAGKIVVRPCRDDEQPAIITAGNKTPPRLEMRTDGDRLVIEVKLSTGWLLRRRSGAQTVLMLRPGPTSLRVNSGAGEIELHDIAFESIDLETGAGQVKT